MKKLLLILLAPLLMGAIGFAVGWALMPRPQQAAGLSTQQPARGGTSYVMPLGRFTIQVLQPERILHVVIDMDVFIADAASFERLGDAQGRARLRDATIAATSDLAETLLWTAPGQAVQIDQQALADQIVLKLNSSLPAVRSARINELQTQTVPRSN
ncbi:flagellar biosynthesis protein FlgH [Pseudodonghicola flavimaris]|uniref:Flagellar biosynthesis protein FlgH n=1 Tax=Pseudodonghicola flavimaris TaxID=3050036 RepID=A0ABT7EWL7_9RHOB|nr:flagellar biosynthesis protein FlgH [Pseudodonghicola flavimaris]MDK3016728.1 flagellar biosynthesis protein FlgH [Pseudodonghicola flavimaris]